jgi:acyl-CoA synthetase (AMP-forming)/AMP-acid ligase II
MSISLLLEMASANPDRTAIVSGELRLTAGELSTLADGGAGVIAASGAQHVAYVGTGGAMLPLLLFAAARADVAFTPLNYRLSADGLRALIDRLPDPLVVVDDEYLDAVGDSYRVLGSHEFIAAAKTTEPAAEFADPDAVAVVLFTSGTTSAPKAVELTHNNLTSYITGTVEFDSADPGDAALICVPPYHIAGLSAAMSNLYAGRKMVYLTSFDATEWVRLVEAEGVTSATVVPTMLDRIVTVFRQRVRAHRDQFHHRGTHPRRSSGRAERAGRGRHPQTRIRWSAGAKHRGADPRRRRNRARRRRNR